MRLKQSAKRWLDMFRKLHHLKTRENAVYKLIEINKAWNQNLKPSDNSQTIQSAQLKRRIKQIDEGKVYSISEAKKLIFDTD